MPALVVSSHEEINTVLARILEVVTAIDTQAYAGPEIRSVLTGLIEVSRMMLHRLDQTVQITELLERSISYREETQ